MKRNKKLRLKAYSLSEILVVLAIIGIIILLVMPNQTSVISQAKSLEAQNMLSHLHGLQKNYFYRYTKYANNLEDIGFVQEKTIEDNGQAIYVITIEEASNHNFIAKARSLADFDGDGIFNEWQIDEKRNLKEIVKD
ncbi:prepilin-type N-terminal cleavage/methylation domain-containing protein [Tenacibaculum maritimum]|nr:prepilin-type N-terminal cleavage/methylation domain-containing protein [Tenacibaculum maritimum]MCD9626180.1 prepilin-type N-terminal cleavage/methylation domain-containing protein [Tenacibaculum maritimum]QCD61797.1 prepilin-type cleavage/methylation domain-containing protein [Tenacibaculum maritimum]CAA0143664.1 Type II secretion system protein G (GspG) [Tenacibaculum maritimum]CAA0160252.1 Type II secretion system protein G (GspG) [Tenacibaculum maritimum]CAA0201462.1 Type II secretion 